MYWKLVLIFLMVWFSIIFESGIILILFFLNIFCISFNNLNFEIFFFEFKWYNLVMFCLIIILIVLVNLRVVILFYYIFLYFFIILFCCINYKNKLILFFFNSGLIIDVWIVKWLLLIIFFSCLDWV